MAKYTRPLVKLVDQHRTGLCPEHRTVIPTTHKRVRLTIAASEQPESPDPLIGAPTYTVRLGRRVPAGLVVACLHSRGSSGGGWMESTALRMDYEPPYPGEFLPDIWTRLHFTPCSKCQAPLVWYEAGYAPGYRVCAGPRHHHFQLSRW